MGLVKRAKNGKKFENTPLMGENFSKFRPQGGGVSSAFFRFFAGARGGGFRAPFSGAKRPKKGFSAPKAPF